MATVFGDKQDRFTTCFKNVWNNFFGFFHRLKKRIKWPSLKILIPTKCSLNGFLLMSETSVLSVCLFVRQSFCEQSLCTYNGCNHSPALNKRGHVLQVLKKVVTCLVRYVAWLWYIFQHTPFCKPCSFFNLFALNGLYFPKYMLNNT